MNVKILIAGIVVACIVVAGIGVYFMLKGGEPEYEIVEPATLTQVTSLGNVYEPCWSPDGSQIVFCERVPAGGGSGKIYIINADGTGLRYLGVDGNLPTWSPVENKIAYVANGIFSTDTEGENPTFLTQGIAPAWSPDGTKIVYFTCETYEVQPGGASSIWVMNSDGSGKTQLTTSADGACSWPSFSYDGSKIVYVKGPTTGGSSNEIWVMDNDGSNKHQIYAPGDSTQLIFKRAWNQDNKILFMRRGHGPAGVWVINSDGSVASAVAQANRELSYGDPMWNHDGTKVVINRETATTIDIYTFSWEGEGGGGEQPSAVDFQFARKITIMGTESFYPGIISANNHFYVSYEVGHPVYVKVYDENFTSTGEEHQLTGDNSGNDHQMVFADNKFYLVYSILGEGLYLKKFDPDWNEIKEVAVAEHAPNMENEVTMDMLLYCTNGSLYVGAVVENNAIFGKEGPGNGLHIRKFNQDLEFQSDYYLSGVGCGFGSSMILRDGTFIMASARGFLEGGYLIILRYDESWNFIEEKRISTPEAGKFSNEHYPMGFLFENGCYFISYTDPTMKDPEIGDDGNITLKVFDSDWNLLGQTNVTDDISPNKANRAHLALVGNKVYVAYDSTETDGRKIFVKEYTIVPQSD